MFKAGFFVGNFMKKQIKNTDKDVDEIAKQWAELVLSQIEINKRQKVDEAKGKNWSQNSHKQHKICTTGYE